MVRLRPAVEAATMRHLRMVLASILILAINAPAYADKAKAAYDRGVRAESQTQYDAAFEAYKEAYALKPKDSRYLAAYLRLRGSAARSEERRVGKEERCRWRRT